MSTLFIRNLSDEEKKAIDTLKAETNSSTMAKAVRKGILAYLRILADYKNCVAENVRLREEIAQMRKDLEKIGNISSQYTSNCHGNTPGLLNAHHKNCLS